MAAPARSHARHAAWFIAAAFAGFMAVPVAATSIAQPWHVEGHSMEPGIQDGSVLLVDTISPHLTGYGRGDIVVLPTPATTNYSFPVLVKRIVAVAGDRVDIRNGRLRVNGVLAAEPYLPAGTLIPPGTPDISIVVPPGRVFVMGDHRQNSFDSKAFGPVPVASLVGRAWFALGPGGDVELPGTAAGPNPDLP
jgi:signal peptidase I